MELLKSKSGYVLQSDLACVSSIALVVITVC
jgi:hypothetical protein